MIGHAFPKHKLNDTPWAAPLRLRFTQGKKTKPQTESKSEPKIEVKSIESWKAFK